MQGSIKSIFVKLQWLSVAIAFVLPYVSAAQMNYVRTFVPTVSTTPTSTTANNSIVATQYYDDAGRPVQEVLERVTPTRQDLTNLTVYGNSGQIARQWTSIPLPHSSERAIQEEPAFTASDYSENTCTSFLYESSPLRRLSSLTGVHTVGKSSTRQVLFNNSDIRHYTLLSEGVVRMERLRQQPLRGLRITDEDGNFQETYTDEFGNIVLERKGHIGSTEVLDTYYIYDMSGLLHCVLPPVASQSMGVIRNYSVTDSELLQQYAYFYRYDSRGNRIATKLPGIGWSHTIYDGEGRPLLTQSPVQAESHQWSYTLYDKFGRPTREGTVVNFLPHKTLVERFKDSLCLDTYTGSGDYGYVSTTSLGAEEKLLRAYYYDNYGFFSLPAFSTLANTSLPDTAICRSLPTGSYTASLETQNGECTAVFYDKRGRAVETRSNNSVSQISTCRRVSYTHLGAVDSASVIYSGHGDVLTQRMHYTYDHAMRPLSADMDIEIPSHSGNSTFSRHYPLFTAAYNEFGRVALLTSLNRCDTIAYTYLNDGRLSSINRNGFSQELTYGQTASGSYAPYLNGRISAIHTEQGGNAYSTVPVYDNFERLDESTLTDDASGTHLSEAFSYDVMGNITQVVRKRNSYNINAHNISYDGHRIIREADRCANRTVSSMEHLRMPVGTDTQTISVAGSFLYDANGRETRNLTYGIEQIRYNLLNLPDSVYFEGGNWWKADYLADGRRAYTLTKTYGTPLSLPDDIIINADDPSAYDPRYREGDIEADDHGFVRLAVPGGYINLGTELNKIERVILPGVPFPQWVTTQVRDITPYIYATDYLGSVRLVRNAETGELMQSLEYLPSGGIFRASGYDFQPYRFCGKEELTIHGMDMYDSMFRWQYSRLPRFSTIDPLAELDYATSPYAYCNNDPVNYIDPWGLMGNGYDSVWEALQAGWDTGRDFELFLNENGRWDYTIILPNAEIVNRKRHTTTQNYFDYDIENYGCEQKHLSQILYGATLALATDDVTGIGISDDIFIPFLCITAIGLDVWNWIKTSNYTENAQEGKMEEHIILFKNHTKGARNSTSDKHTKKRPGNNGIGQHRNDKRGSKNEKYRPQPNPNKRK